MSELRKRVWVDSRVQGALARRILMYWCFAWIWILGFAALALSFYSYVIGDLSPSEILDRLAGQFGLSVFVSLLALPIVLRDCIRQSHRIAGPIVKLRHATQQVTQGQVPEPVQLRDGDCWQDFAREFNEMLAALKETQEPTSRPIDQTSVNTTAHDVSAEVATNQKQPADSLG